MSSGHGRQGRHLSVFDLYLEHPALGRRLLDYPALGLEGAALAGRRRRGCRCGGNWSRPSSWLPGNGSSSWRAPQGYKE